LAVTEIKIPTINDQASDFKRLFWILEEAEATRSDIRFTFSTCLFLRPNAVAFLGGLARQIESKGRSVTFDWDTLKDNWVKTTLRQNGFAGMFGDPSSGWSGDCIPYREDPSRDANAIMDYLEESWLGRGWVHVSKNLTDAIVGRVWEIYNNAFEHSESHGVYSCGQYFKHHNDLILSVVDFGHGIPENVKYFLKRDPRANLLTAAACLRWAFQRGNTTKTDEPGGLGLDLLKELVCLNQGKLEVYSNEAYVLIDKSGEQYENIAVSFKGTAVHITLRCDEKLYRFANEI